jgi:pyridoxine kinase
MTHKVGRKNYTPRNAARVHMAKVLSISSQVVYGHVGNSSAGFVLQRMGHDVLGLPTIILSNRPGYKHIAGERSDPAMLHKMLEAILSNGWLDGVDAILTGYLTSTSHVELCERWIAKIKGLNTNAVYLCDPIIGDDPSGIYLDEAAARSIRALLVPHADILTPNCFELSWLSGRRISGGASAVAAARSLSLPAVIVTSAPGNGPNTLANILVEGDEACATLSDRRTIHAHGTGDFFASNFLGHTLNGLSRQTSLRAATAAIELILEKSGGKTELSLIETQAEWGASDPALAPLTTLPGITVTP